MRVLVPVAAAGLSIAAAIVFAWGTAAGPDPDPAGPATLRCTNPFSGATWDVPVDPARQTADAFPARVTGRSIQWRDAVRGGRYEFDRASGELTVTYASSTGGFSLRDTCRLLADEAAPG